MLRTSIAASLGALAVLTAACSDDIAGPLDELQEAQATWERVGPESYQYVYHVLCFCAIVEPVRVVVAADSVVAAFLVEGNAPLPDHQAAWMPTIDDLFERLESVLDQDPVEYRAEFDPVMGFPAEASVDISRQIADEEFSFTAYDLVSDPQAP